MEIYDEIQELLDSLQRESLEDLLKEIAEAPIPFIDYEPIPKARRTRRRKSRQTTTSVYRLSNKAEQSWERDPAWHFEGRQSIRLVEPRHRSL